MAEENEAGIKNRRPDKSHVTEVMAEEKEAGIKKIKGPELPLDRGWAWIILLGCFMVLFLIVGTLKSFGLFFVAYLQEFDTTASMVSLVFSIQTAMFSFAAFFVLTLGNKYLTTRKMIMAGGFVAALGYCLNGLAPTVYFLIFSQGILHGTGCAMSYGPGLVLLSSYFEKRKGLANSLANVGGSLGGLILPLIVRHLIDEYGLRGALMIISGLIFNITVAGALMRSFPVVEIKEIYNSENGMSIDLDENESPKVAIGSNRTNNGVCVDMDKIEIEVANGSIGTSTGNRNDESVIKLLRLESQVSNYSNNSARSRISSTRVGSTKSIDKHVDRFTGNALELYGSMTSIERSVPVLTLGQSKTSINDTSHEDNTSGRFCLCTYCFDLCGCYLLKNYKFRLLMVVGFLCVFGSALVITFIPPFAKDHDVPDKKIALLVTISAISDFIGRFSVAWIADSGVIRRHHLIGTSLGIASVAAMLNFLYTDFPSFAAYSAIHGLVGGVYFSLYPVLVVEAVGQENLSGGLAILFQVHGSSLMINSFLIGYLRDVTGSYRASFLLMGSGLLLGAICLFCEPLVMKLERKRLKNVDELTENMTDAEINE